MENASKALIIAGAILLAILIITLGITVVRNTQGVVNRANVNQQEVETFNGQFDKYVGSDRTASDVTNMISAVISSNGAEYTNKTYRYVAVSNNGNLPDDPGQTKPSVVLPSNLINGHTYTITVDTNNDGYINRITYNDNTNSATPNS